MNKNVRFCVIRVDRVDRVGTGKNIFPVHLKALIPYTHITNWTGVTGKTGNY